MTMRSALNGVRPNLSRLCQIIVLLSGVIISGCSRDDEQTRKMVATNAVTAQSLAAIDFMRHMKEEGRLPGYSKDEHGKLTSDPVPITADSRGTYPASFTFRITKNGDPSTYNYSVLCPSK